MEFALIAPLMILLYVGLAQLSSAIIASRHTSHASSSLGDLVSQCANINDSDLGNIFAAASDIMAPLSPALNLNQRVSSIKVVDNAGTTQAQWSKSCVVGSSGTCSTSTTLAPYAQNQAVTVPTNLVSNQGDTVIVSETVYTYTFGASSLNNLIKFDDLSYFKPRKSALVNYIASGTSCYS